MDEFETFLHSKYPNISNLFDRYNIQDDIDEDDNFSKGFSFIMPNEVIMDTIERSKDRAKSKLLKSMIVSGYFPNSTSWRNINNTIDMNGNVVTLLSARGSTVTLNSGSGKSVITMVRNIEGTCPISVYQLSEDSDLPGIVQNPISSKQMVTKPTIKKSMRSELEAKFLGATGLESFCARYLASFLFYLSTRDSQLLKALVPLLDYNPVTNFMNVFEIHKKDGFFINTLLINDWLNSEIDTPSSFYFQTLEKYKPSLPQGLIAEINSLRTKLYNTRSANDKLSMLNELYDTLVDDNNIGKYKNIYPSATIELLKKAEFDGNIKAIHDEMRTVVDCVMNGTTSKNMAREICYQAKLIPRIFNERIIFSFSSSQVNEVLNQFINSTYFLAFRIANCEFGGTATIYSESSDSSSLIDPCSHYYKQHCLDKYTNTEIVEHSDLDNVVSEIKKYKSKNQPIPPELRKQFNDLTK